MSSRKTSAPLGLQMRDPNVIATWGASTHGSEGEQRRVCLTKIPVGTTVDDIRDFFPEDSIEGIHVRKSHNSIWMAFVQFKRPVHHTEALLRNHEMFLNKQRIQIRPYASNSKPPPRRRSPERRDSSPIPSYTSRAIAWRPDSPPQARRSRQSLGRPRSRDRSRTRSPVHKWSLERARTPDRTRSPNPHRSPVRTRSPVRARSPDRRRTYRRSRSRSTSRDRTMRQRERSPSLDRSSNVRIDPFLPNDRPNPNEEMEVRQQIALRRHQQEQAMKGTPITHAFGVNSSALVAYTSPVASQAMSGIQTSQPSYVNSMQRIFAEGSAQPPPPSIQQNQQQVQPQVDNDLPAGVDLVLKYIIEQKTARNCSLAQISHVMDYLTRQKRLIQQSNSTNPEVLEQSSTENVENNGSLNDGDLRLKLDSAKDDMNADSRALEIAKKIRKLNGIKEEGDA